jgi:hypothetical protein
MPYEVYKNLYIIVVFCIYIVHIRIFHSYSYMSIFILNIKNFEICNLLEISFKLLIKLII